MSEDLYKDFVNQDWVKDHECDYSYPDKRIRPFVWRKSDGRCWYCGCRLDPWKFHVDHFEPRSKGGSNKLDNLVPSCQKCNITKKDREVWKWSCDLQISMGLNLGRAQLMSLKGEGINVDEDIYQWETPVIFWYQSYLELFPQYYRVVRYKGWQP